MSSAEPVYRTDDILNLQERTRRFKDRTGRRPRILLSSMGKNVDASAVKIFATAYADAGFDVDISPSSMIPELVAKMAVENDVHVVGISESPQGRKIHVSDLYRALKEKGADDVRVMADHDPLIELNQNRAPDIEALAVRLAGKALNILEG